MIANQISKTDFVVSALKRDVVNVYSAMNLIARKNIYIEGSSLEQKRGKKGSVIGQRSGSLRRSLENPRYSITGSAGRFIVTANVVLHMRFLDMKRKGNRRIYNRQLWGILYKNTYPDLKYKYGEAVSDHLGDALRSAFAQASEDIR